MLIRLLGPVGVADQNGRFVRLGAAQQRRLLAALAIDIGKPVSLSKLIEILWPEGGPGSEARTLHTYVSRLRAELGRDAIRTDTGTYTLSSDAAELDTALFEQLIRRANNVDQVEAIACYDEALKLWEGPAFGELADEWWARAAATRLEELRLAARSARLDAMLASDRVAEAAAESELLVALDPLRESFVRQRMIALHLGGRSAEALRAGVGFRRRLADQSGLEASPELAALEQRILDHHPEVAPPTRAIRGYRIGELIAQGAHGAIYAATQPSLSREVAIKRVRGDRADDPDFVRRFEAEAQLVARLEHPSIVPLYDYWREPGGAFLVFRLLRGGSLQDRLDRHEKLAGTDIDLLVDRIAGALAASHRAGVVHRDVRAANVLYDDDGHPYLSDFGIAVPGGKEAAVDDVQALAELVGGLLSLLVPAEAATLENARSVLRRAVSGEISTAADLAAEWRLARGLRVTASPTPDHARRPSMHAPVSNPYRGLRPFTEADRSEFYGRATVTHELAIRVREQRFVIVTGPSGSGKSSVVLAGVVPALRDDGFAVTTMTPGVRPMVALSLALARVAAEEHLADLDEDPAGVLRIVAHRHPLLLVIDQLEELWTLSVEVDRQAFVAAIDSCLSEPSSQLRVVATLRADFYDRPLTDPILGPLARTGTFPLVSLDPDELEAAIVKPLAGSGVDIEAGLASRLVQEVSARPGALPLLQFSLAALFDQRDGTRLTHEAFDRLGGIGGAVSSGAEHLYRQLTPDDQARMQRLFCSLVTPGDGQPDTRRRAARSELGDIPSAMFDRLGQARMVTFDRDPATGEPTVELAHEALIAHWPRLSGWLELGRDELRTRRSVRESTTAWLLADHDPSHLFRGARLADASVLDRTLLSPDQLEFLDVSVAEDEHERAAAATRLRRTRGLLSAIAALLVVALFAAGIAVSQRHEADKNANRAGVAAAQAASARDDADRARINAELRRVAFEARTIAPSQPDLALLLAAEVNQRLPGVEADSALLGALQANPLVERVIDLGLDDTSRLQTLRGRSPGPLAAASADTVVVIDGRTLKPSGVRWTTDERADVAVSIDGTEIASASRTGLVERHDVSSGALIGTPLHVAPGAFFGQAIPVAYVAGGRLALANGKQVQLIDRGATKPSRVFDFTNTVTLLVASPDGTQLVVTTGNFPPIRSHVIALETGVMRDFPAGATAAAYSADGARLYVGEVTPSSSDILVEYDARTLQEVARATPAPLFHALVPLPSGEILVSDVTTRVFLVAPDLRSQRSFPLGGPAVTVALSSRNVLGYDGSRLVALDLRGLSSVVTDTGLQGAVALSADGSTLLVAGAQSARTYRADTFAPIGPAISDPTIIRPTPPPGTQSTWAPVLSPDGRYAVATSRAGLSATVFDMRAGTAVAAPLYALGPPTFSPDGRQLAVPRPGGLDLYEFPRLKLTRTIPVPIDVAAALSWSPDGTKIFLALLTNGGRMIDLTTGKVEIATGQFGAYSPDGRQLATFELSEATQVVDLRSHRTSYLPGFRELGFGRFVGNTRLFRTTTSGYFDLLDIASASRVGAPFPFQSNPQDAILIGFALSPDGKYVFVGGPGASVRRITLDPARWATVACDVAGRNLSRAEWDRYFGSIAAYDRTCPNSPPGR